VAHIFDVCLQFISDVDHFRTLYKVLYSTTLGWD